MRYACVKSSLHNREPNFSLEMVFEFAMSNSRPQRALVSASDKSGLESFVRGLTELGFEILSTGGTRKFLEQAGIPVIDVTSYTGFPEIMDGRVKTLHPKVHGAILGRPTLASDAKAIETHGIIPFQVVVSVRIIIFPAGRLPAVRFAAQRIWNLFWIWAISPFATHCCRPKTCTSRKPSFLCDSSGAGTALYRSWIMSFLVTSFIIRTIPIAPVSRGNWLPIRMRWLPR